MKYFPFALLAILLVISCQPSSNSSYPIPTDIAENQREDEAFKKARKDFFEQMHRAAPNVNWRQMDRQVREEKAARRMAILQEDPQWRGDNPAYVKDTVANGQMIGHWREIGSNNQSGRIHTSAYDPATDKMYLASSGGNIWVGPKDGSDWQVRNDLFQMKGIEFMELADGPSGPRLLVDRTEWDVDGFMYSDDDGFTWHAATGLESITSWGYPMRTVMVPDSAQTIYMLAREWDNVSWQSAASVYRSTDLGESFERLAIFPSGTFGGHNQFDLWTDAHTPGEVYLLNGTNLHKVQMDTLTQVASFTLTTGSGEVRLTGTGNTLYAGYRIGSNVHVYQSTDAGQNWVYRNTAPTSLFFRTSFYCAPHDSLSLFAGGINAYHSPDGGATWNLVSEWWEYYQVPSIRLHADIPSFKGFRDSTGTSFIITSTDGGAYISYDNLATVSNISLEGLNVSQYYSTYTNQNNPGIIYVGTQDQGYQRSTVDDGGVLNFEQVISGDYGHLSSANGGQSIWCNYPGFTMFYPTAVSGSQDFMLSFPTEGQLWLAPLIAEPTDPHKAYLGGGHLPGSSGVHMYEISYTGNSLTYQELPHNFPGGGSISAMAISNINTDYWYVLTTNSNFNFSFDGGTSWNTPSLSDLPGSQWFYGNSILPSPVQLGRVYIGGSGYSNSPVWLSIDNGQSFMPIQNGLPNTLVYELACTPDESMVFAATEVGPYVYIPAENQWYPLEGMHAPDQTYWSVEYVPALHVARFGTYGRGIWDFVICDSLSPLQAEFNYSLFGDGITVNFINQSNGAYSYEWDFGDGQTSTEFESNHYFPGSGAYQVKLIASNHCFRDTFEVELLLTETGIFEDLSSGPVSLFPNPNSGQFFLQIPTDIQSPSQVKIFSLQGQLMMETELAFGGKHAFQMKDFSSGIYLLQVENEQHELSQILKVEID